MSEEYRSSSNDKHVNSEQPYTDNFASLIPDKARGMKKLEKSIYNIKINLPAIKCKAKSCGKFLSVCKQVLLKRAHFHKIISDPSIGNEFKLILLDPSINKIDKLSEKQQNLIVEEDAIFFCKHSLLISYKDFTFSEIIQSIIPEEVENVNSFETVGHIAHLNLKVHLEEYKYVIGMYFISLNINCTVL